MILQEMCMYVRKYLLVESAFFLAMYLKDRHYNYKHMLYCVYGTNFRFACCIWACSTLK